MTGMIMKQKFAPCTYLNQYCHSIGLGRLLSALSRPVIVALGDYKYTLGGSLMLISHL